MAAGFRSSMPRPGNWIDDALTFSTAGTPIKILGTYADSQTSFSVRHNKTGAIKSEEPDGFLANQGESIRGKGTLSRGIGVE
jgi:hypothetical protein